MTLTQLSVITLGAGCGWVVRWLIQQELTRMKARAWDEGAEAEAGSWCLTAIPCGSCANCNGPELVNPYRSGASE